jgi:hypothetical protein
MELRVRREAFRNCDMFEIPIAYKITQHYDLGLANVKARCFR